MTSRGFLSDSWVKTCYGVLLEQCVKQTKLLRSISQSITKVLALTLVETKILASTFFQNFGLKTGLISMYVICGLWLIYNIYLDKLTCIRYKVNLCCILWCYGPQWIYTLMVHRNAYIIVSSNNGSMFFTKLWCELYVGAVGKHGYI